MRNLLSILVVLKPIFRLVGYIFPHSKGKILFFSKGWLFHDNPKYLFEYVCKQKIGHPLWASRCKEDIELISEKYGDNYIFWAGGFRGRLRLLYHYLTAPVVIIRGQNDLWSLRNLFGISRKIVIDLCHGVPLKMTGIMQYRHSENTIRLEIQQRRTVTYHTVSSDIERYFLSACYFTDIRRFPITGDPRNDRIFELMENENDVKETLLKLANIQVYFEKVILYAPTHRDASVYGQTDITIPKFFPFSDYEEQELIRFLERNKAILILRTHNQDNIFGGGLMSAPKSSLEHPRVKYLPHSILRDINEILPIVDILITDYSGIFLDFLLCNRPILFIPYDLEEYTKNIRGLLFDYDLFTPGPKISSFHQFLSHAQESLDNPKLYEKERLYVKRVFHKYPDGNSSQRVTELFLSKLD